MHPTVKPAVMVADAILDVTHRGDAVFDGFCGSGTTLVAAHQTHRVGYGIELNPAYVDVALHRLRRETGIEPVLAETGEGFDTVAERRLRNKSDNEEIGDE
jgi:DNA modification methylase